MRRVVIVTGRSRGIGAATAVAAARHGFDVGVGYQYQAAEADAVVAACEREGARALAVRADVTDAGDVDALLATVESELGPLWGLVNNAGIAAPRARVVELTAERIENLLRTNVLSAFLVCRAAVLRMTPRHGGVIVNISSRAAVLGSPGEYVDYAASKAAVDTLTVGLAKEVAADGIRVNGVRPGLIHTDIHAAMGQPDRIERLAPTVPLGRGGQPEEVAEAIVWLLSDAASYVTGAILDVSGGR